MELLNKTEFNLKAYLKWISLYQELDEAILDYTRSFGERSTHEIQREFRDAADYVRKK
jgi:hypothetical protein